jgi:hypothetical protein
MEWLTGLALLPALVCGAMMGGMALMGVLGLRRNRNEPHDARESETQVPPADRDAASR